MSQHSGALQPVSGALDGGVRFDAIMTEQHEILLMMRNTMARQLQPGLSNAERQALVECMKCLVEALRLAKAYETIETAVEWLSHQRAGFFERLEVDIQWVDGHPTKHKLCQGVDWKALLATGVAIAPFMAAAPALLPVLAAIEGIDAVLMAAVAATAVRRM